MQAREYETLRALEDEHWWYAVLRGLVLCELTARVAPTARVLDAGCGTGGTMELLRRVRPRWLVQGIDRSDEAVSYCRERGLDDVEKGDVGALPFEKGTFDAVLSLDVLYHATVDEERTMREMVRVLRGGGAFVLNLPAFDCLRGSHDVAVCGTRRYTVCKVRTFLARHNLQAEMIHYWNAWLFLALLAWRQWSRRRSQQTGIAASSDLTMPPRWLNTLLAAFGKADAVAGRALRLPFGSSVFAAASKPPGGLGN